MARYTPADEIARAEQRAFIQLFDEFQRLTKRRAIKKLADGDIPDWYDDDSESTFQTQFDNLCAKPTKDISDMLNISALSAVLTNFMAPSATEAP